MADKKKEPIMMTKQDIIHFSTGKYEPYMFVSYSHDDEELVTLLVERLREEGFCLWVDYHNLRGQHFADEIRDGIRECSVFLECLSKSYIGKPYCEKEYLCADSENKNILAVCLDDIMVKDSPNRFPIGGNAIGYGKGIGVDFEHFVQEILQQAVIRLLKAFMKNNKTHLTMKYVFVDQRLTERLKSHCLNSYRKSGNYCLDKIHKELFPGIADVSRERVYKAENAEHVSLYEYIVKDIGKEHVLLKGNGGMGKTVSMLQTCEKLLNNGICAVYVPLHAIDFRSGGNIEKYIESTICGNDPHILNNLRTCAREIHGDRNVFLFIDGINELPLGYAGEIVQKQIVEGLFGNYAWAGTRFVLSSRYALPQSEDIFENVKVLEMLPLEKEQIAEYLRLREIIFPQNEKVQQLLSNPLMLSLYADAEVYRAHYEKKGKIYNIHLEENPDTSGKIIRNFLQTQLMQMTSIAGNDYMIYFVLLEYALPYVAYEMIKKDSPITLKEVRDILRSACDPDKNMRFKWLEKDKLEDILWEVESAGAEFTRKDVKNLFLYAVDKYRFLYKTNLGDGEEDYVEFLHQDFRDYFAAYHVANEVYALQCVPERIQNKEEQVLSEGILSEEIVEYCSDILHEEDACPWKDENGWHFPGKMEIEPSKYSVIEQLLSRYRGCADKEDEYYYRPINTNLLAMMRCGRKNCLAQCDFSELDLRLCHMNGCHFSEFYKEKIYASNFDGAIMDRTFFLGNGHSDEVTALCPGRKNEILSGDQSGCVYLWNYKNGNLKKVFQFEQQGAVVDLTFFEEKGIVGVAYGKQIVLYDLENETFLEQKKMKTFQSQYYRKICFDKYGKLKYTYDLQPYHWYYLEGTTAKDNIRFSILTGCAEVFKGAQNIQLLYSELYQRVRVLDCDSSYINMDFDKKKEPDNKIFRIRYINIRDEVHTKQRISAIHYNRTGERFIVVAGKYILEYESKNLSLLRKIHFRKDVHEAAYIYDGGMVVAVGKDIFVLNSKWSVMYSLRHEERERVQIFHSFGERYYIISQDNVVKELNAELCVTRMAKGPSCGQFTWVRDKKTDEIQMLFVKSGAIEAGERYSFETGEIIPAGWCFEITEIPEDFSRREFVMRDQVEVFDIYDGEKIYVYENHCGIWIFGCSFKKIQGTLAEVKNVQILMKNGGIVDE